MTPKRFTLLLLVNIGLILLVVASINRVIDPFWYYRDIEIDGLNKVKTKMRRFERHVKPMIIAREQPDALIFGSSYSEIGLDPTSPAFTNDGRLQGYNFAIAGADWERTQCYFVYAINNAKIKRALVGINTEDMPLVDCKGKLPEIEEFSETKLLLSIKALSASISTLSEQRKNTPSHSRGGMYFYIRGVPGVSTQFRKFFADRQKKLHCDMKGAQQFLDTPAKLANELPAADASVDLEGLRRLVSLAKDKGIELRLFVYPKHAYWLEIDAVCGAYKNYWSALASIAAVVRQEGGNAEIWEFTRYNDYTAEPINQRSAIYWQDPEHFNYEFGNLMFEAIYNKNTQNDFGSKLTTDTLHRSYQDYLTSREAYLHNHGNFLGALRQLVQ